MRNIPPVAIPLLFLSLVAAACTPEPAESNASESASAEPARSDIGSASGNTTEDAAPSTPPSPAGNVIGLEGLGELRVGQPVPARSSWASRGAQIEGGCRTVSSPDFPGVYAIVTDGRVQRITVGERSDVKLVEGIGVGAPEQAVRDAFAGFREEPHKYVDAPAKYLTAPNAASGDAALRFEIGRDGAVSLIHVGMMPVLGYVEGCA